MAFNNVNDLRRSAAVTTSGPGAIVDARAGSAPVSGVHAGLESWDQEAPLQGELLNQKIYERRLLAKLNKSYFRLAPVVLKKLYNEKNTGQAEPSLLLRRFPNWLQCSKCSIIRPATKWANEPGKAFRFCPNCTAKNPGKSKEYVVPVRLVAACVNGHLEDFPWNWWVKHKNQCNKATAELKLYSKGTGLGGFHLLCTSCKSEKAMENAFNKHALKGLQCEGKRPWLDEDDIECECSGEKGDYRALQRGASNLYYPIFESALDIPPWTETIQVLINEYWDDLSNIEDESQRILWIKMTKSLLDAANLSGFSAEDISNVFSLMKNRSNLSSNDDIKHDEYKVFCNLTPTKHLEFESYPLRVNGTLSKYLETLTRVPRLREVRVLRGFTRIRPPQEGVESKFSELSMQPLNWLPAVELRGEGIFIALDIEKVKQWEQREVVSSRVNEFNEVFRHEFNQRFPTAEIAPELSARKYLIHTMSHMLMRQLTLECGYSSASLRERLYVGEEKNGMCGVLIYTGTADSDGTLGGLQARAEENLFLNTFESAMKSAAWCSSDPICIEGSMSPVEMHSGASCHSCLLTSETSCETFNKFLDRAMLVGTTDSPELGFFAGDN